MSGTYYSFPRTDERKPVVHGPQAGHHKEKGKMKHYRLSILIVVVALLAIAGGRAFGQDDEPAESERENELLQVEPLALESLLGTAFTYQGHLRQSGTAVSGACDFQFGLYDAVSGGAQIGTTQTKSNVAVSGGLFTVADLDFGAGAFNGLARWLAIGVRCPAGSGSYTPLTPRQALTPAPYALALPGFYTRQNATSPNLIGGHISNTVARGVVGATIGGGGAGGGANSVTGSYGTVGGGLSNMASGLWSGTVGGGQNNMASGSYSTIAGGDSNITSAWNATVGGGWKNTASNGYATVGGGQSNSASGQYSTVGGGRFNTASGQYSTVGGGLSNTASGYYATVGGGQSNTASGYYATVGGGQSNTASGLRATAGGGLNNSISAEGATIGGGYTNTIPITGTYATIGGGLNNNASDSTATVGGGYNNTASAWNATVGGGSTNTASNGHATVGGGYSNTASGVHSTIGGGISNTASDHYSTVGGGDSNIASGQYSTVGGGRFNTASGQYSTVGGGGWSNIASGYYATVPGGADNVAQGYYSFAAGRGARAYNTGCFVWSDNSTVVNVPCNVNNRWVARSSGGVYFYTNSTLSSGVFVGAGGNAWSSVSDRALKENVVPVNGREVLAQLAALPLATWNYLSEDAAVRHMGPMAQDFYAAFGLGDSGQHISTIDADGVALAAIQGLYEIVQAQEAEIAGLEARLAALEKQVNGSQAALPTRFPGWLALALGLGGLAAGLVWNGRQAGRR
jgi:trimeric autotransporter adhesin